MARPTRREGEQLARLEGAMFAISSAQDTCGLLAVRVRQMRHRLERRWAELGQGAAVQLGDLVDDLEQARSALREELAVLQAERSARNRGS